MIGLVDGNNFFVSCERVIDPKLNGKAVAVLSNNDGCCVSRSNEFKALGIAMGTPAFQLKDRVRAGEIILKSSNYELYSDLSRRVMSILRESTLGIEQYSIDESYIYPPTNVDLLDWGGKLRAKILQWVGIPCGVGFAPTKTLAKIANHIAKKSKAGVYVLEGPVPDLPVEEVWGIGRRLVHTLHAENIYTIHELLKLDDEKIRFIGGVTLLRTVIELKGTPALEARDYDEDPESISYSRTFAQPVTTIDGINESVSTYIAQAAEKLRKYKLLASGCQVYAQYGTHCDHGYTEGSIVFPAPTDDTSLMLKVARRQIAKLFVPGLKYRKSGMVFFGLEKADGKYQPDLFTVVEREQSGLYKSIDGLNARFGRRSIRLASEGAADAAWHVRRDILSPCATTRWDQLLEVR